MLCVSEFLHLNTFTTNYVFLSDKMWLAFFYKSKANGNPVEQHLYHSALDTSYVTTVV